MASDARPERQRDGKRLCAAGKVRVGRERKTSARRRCGPGPGAALEQPRSPGMGALRPRRGRELRDLYGPLRPRPAPPAPRSHDVPEIPAEPTLRPTATPCAQRGSARGTRRAVGKEEGRRGGGEVGPGLFCFPRPRKEAPLRAPTCGRCWGHSAGTALTSLRAAPARPPSAPPPRCPRSPHGCGRRRNRRVSPLAVVQSRRCRSKASYFLNLRY